MFDFDINDEDHFRWLLQTAYGVPTPIRPPKLTHRLSPPAYSSPAAIHPRPGMPLAVVNALLTDFYNQHITVDVFGEAHDPDLDLTKVIWLPRATRRDR